MRVCLLLLALPLAAEPLWLEEVLGSVERHYPPLLAALAERDIADADLVAALGKFDFSLGVRADTDQFGFYPNERFAVVAEQPTQLWGGSFYGGWRLGRGRYPSYEGKQQTNSEGQYFGGFKLPLFRDREIDEKRADLRKAHIGRRIADLSIDQQRLLILQLAARRYWDWLAAGQRFSIARDVLRIAVERDQALKDAVELGQIARVEVTDNLRAILQRRSQLVEAERGGQLASIELSLFYRDDSGKPRLATVAQLPPAMPSTSPLAEERYRADLEQALRRRPEIGRLSELKEQALIEIKLYENQRLPEIDLGLGFTSEAGEGNVRRGPSDLKASLTFDLPFQRRVASGKLAASQAKFRQLQQREAFARDQVAAEVADAASAVRAAHERVLLITEEIAVARELEQAERDRFRLGDSTLFLVNLREQATVDAAVREVAAHAEYFRALAQYELATAMRLTPVH